MNCRALMAYIYDADALARHVIPDRLDMAALKAEDEIDAARLEKPGDPGGGGGFVGVEVDGDGHGIRFSSPEFDSGIQGNPDPSRKIRIEPIIGRRALRLTLIR